MYQSDVVYNKKDKNTLENLQSDEKSSETIKIFFDPIEIIGPKKSLSERLKSKIGRLKGSLGKTFYPKPFIDKPISVSSDYCTIIKFTVETSYICDDTSDKKNNYELLKDVDKIYVSNEKSDDTSDKKNDYELLKDVDKIYISNEKIDDYIEI